MLRIIGDVHAQIDRENLAVPAARPYLELIAAVPYSVQIGDMGDHETYAELERAVDPAQHRFFPGNHDHYDRLPPHSLGDWGTVTLGGTSFFFVRGAASIDRDNLLRLGERLKKKLWFSEEELTDRQMADVEAEYLTCRPKIVLSHDAPTEIAREVLRVAQRYPSPTQKFRESRTNAFLTRLLNLHGPELWVFGHHHRDWNTRLGATRFYCVGELSYLDVDAEGRVQTVGR